MKKRLLVVWFANFILLLQAQTSANIPSSLSVANASVADNQQFSPFANPATLGEVSGMLFGFQYENKFLIKELSQKSIYVAAPNSLMNVGVVGSYFGYAQYNETVAGIALSRNFGGVFSLGFQYNYYRVYFAGSNSYYGTFFPQIGLQYFLSKRFTIGFSTHNPAQQNLKTASYEKIIPSVFSLGGKWMFENNVRFLCQFDKDMHGNYRLAGGFDYCMKDFLLFQMGAYQTEYLVPTLGVGIKSGSFDVNLHADLHPVLGLNSFASVQFHFQSNH
ncbi:MAG: hypothetical protein AUK44_01885 [Porphyromonadaceae bacterium CG2_30_38_12]|nr:MAG: hypothetical protein AUK44_01885 [Porphyromonadaceae bacterium CG2_30_38_12]